MTIARCKFAKVLFLQTALHREWTIHKKKESGLSSVMISSVELVKCCNYLPSATCCLCFLSVVMVTGLFFKEDVHGWHPNSGHMCLYATCTAFFLSVHWRLCKRGWWLKFRKPNFYLSSRTSHFLLSVELQKRLPGKIFTKEIRAESDNLNLGLECPYPHVTNRSVKTHVMKQLAESHAARVVVKWRAEAGCPNAVCPMQGCGCIWCSVLVKYSQFSGFAGACFFAFTRGQRVGL